MEAKNTHIKILKRVSY
ncbi:hypothetical protein LT321_002567, partial [Enterococcus faecalis]|nr:hypothetical protein [Enterococcus faecalis]